MTPPQIAEDNRLWCLHVSGMDEVHPAPDRATAQLWAIQHTLLMHNWRPNPRPMDPIVSFTVCEWPWSRDRHAAGLEESIKANTRPGLPSTVMDPRTAATTLRDAHLIRPEEFNRIIQRIEARDRFREVMG